MQSVFRVLPLLVRATSVLLCGFSVFQDDRDTDPTRLPGNAEAFYRLAQFEAAEKDLRAQLAKEPGDALRTGLMQVLLRARKYDEALKEAAAAGIAAKDDAMRAFAISVEVECKWRLGDRVAAKRHAEAALKLADAKGASAYPAVRRSIAVTLGFLEWSRTPGKHVAVWRAPGASDGATLAARFDAAFEAMAAELVASVPDRIDVFVFADQRQADAILATALNFAAPRDRAVYVLETASTGHELARVVLFFAASSKGKARPACALLVEGASVAFAHDELWTKRLVDVPARLAQKGTLKRATELAKATAGDSEFVSCAGSFVRMLYDRYGKEKWLKLWTEFNDGTDPWSAVYGKPLEELDAEWRAHVSR